VESEPGDVLVHHAMTVHGAPANNTQDRRRRAIAVRFADRRLATIRGRGRGFTTRVYVLICPLPDLQAGDALRGELFPRVWPSEPVAAAS